MIYVKSVRTENFWSSLLSERTNVKENIFADAKISAARFSEKGLLLRGEFTVF
jgi:hypothetical protein